MKSAVVTGASGFIGRYLVWELLDHDYEVLALVHRKENIKVLERPGKRTPRTVVCDMAEIGLLPEYAENAEYEYFFHMAWAGVSGPVSGNYAVQMQNVQYAVDALKAASAMSCSRFIGAGSLHEIECMKEMELPRRIENKTNYYKTAKLAAYYNCKLMASELEIDFLWPRLTNTYGAGEISNRLLNSVIRQLLRGESPSLTQGDQLYNFIYITDAARAYRLIAEKGVSYANYILGSEEVCPLREYLLKLRDVVNPKVEMGFGKHLYHGIYLRRDDLYTKDLFLDTNFKTEISFSKGIKLTLDWIKKVLRS